MTQRGYFTLEIGCDFPGAHPGQYDKVIAEFSSDTLAGALRIAARAGWQVGETPGDDDLCPHCAAKVQRMGRVVATMQRGRRDRKEGGG